jgi:hypothetical protein
MIDLDDDVAEPRSRRIAISTVSTARFSSSLRSCSNAAIRALLFA